MASPKRDLIPGIKHGEVSRQEELLNKVQGLPWWLGDKESAYQCKRHGWGP